MSRLREPYKKNTHTHTNKQQQHSVDPKQNVLFSKQAEHTIQLCTKSLT